MHTTQLVVMQRYAHIFWIPFFPLGKTGATQCSHCKLVLKKKEFNASLKENYENIASQAKTPIWTFSGLIVVAALIGWGSITSSQNKAKLKEMATAPKSGDIYGVMIANKQYTIYKVTHLGNDSIYYQESIVECTNIRDMKRMMHKGDEIYDGTEQAMHKDDLNEMFEQGDLVDIERK